MNATQIATVSPSSAQPPHVIIIERREESLLSRGIGDLLGRHVVELGAMAFVSGAISAALFLESNPLILGAASAAVVMGVASLGVKTLQFAVDVAVDATLFAVKLPFRLAFAAIQGTALGVQSVYTSIQAEKQPEQERLSSSKALAGQDKIA